MENTLFSHRERELKYPARDGANATAEASLMQQRVSAAAWISITTLSQMNQGCGGLLTIPAQVNKKTGTVKAPHFTGSVVDNGIICLQERGIIINDNICKCFCASLSIYLFFVVVVKEPEGRICRALTATFNYTLCNINTLGPIFNHPHWMWCVCVYVW